MNIEEAFPRGKPGQQQKAGSKKRPQKQQPKIPAAKRKADMIDDLFKPASKQRDHGQVTAAAKKAAANKEKENAAIEGAESEKPEILKLKQIEGQADVKCTLLQLNDLEAGFLVLGSICQIFDYRLVLSLPGGIRGFVSISEISDVYTQDLQAYAANPQTNQPPPALQQIFSIGQLVQCRVADKTTKEMFQNDRRSKNGEKVRVTKDLLNLTVNPRSVNADLGASETSLVEGMMLAGAVTSVEDKGYVVDLGMGPNLRAFIKNSDAAEFEQQHNGGNRLSKHQVLPFIVAELRNGFVGLKLEATFKRKDFENISMRCIMPGLLLQMDVLEHRRNGLVLQMTSGAMLAHSSNPIFGSVHWRHAPAAVQSYQVGKTVTVTVLYVDPLSKVIHCSLLRHLRKINGFEAGPQEAARLAELAVGMFFEDAKVTRIDGKKAVLFDVSEAKRSDSNVSLIFNKAYAKMSHLDDKKLDTIDEEQFGEGTTHRCRVVGLSYIDGCYIVSLKQAILKNAFQSMASMSPGDKLTVKVDLVESVGLRVSVDQAKFIGGFIPMIQAVESSTKMSLEMLEKRFPIGSKLKCRVLMVDSERMRLILTTRKKLIKSKFDIWTHLEQIRPHESITDGYVIKVVNENKGLLVGFYNNLVGFMPRSLLPPYCRAAQDLKALFHAGQIITCRCKSKDLNKRNITVEMVTHEELEQMSENQPLDSVANKKQENAPAELSQLKNFGDKWTSDFKLDQVVENAKIISKKESAFQVLIGEKIIATLPFEHLSDFPENSALLAKSFNASDIIPKLVVINNQRRLILSRKGSLLEAAENDQLASRLVKTEADIQPGQLFIGWVVSIADYGLFIGFPGQTVALAPRKYLSDRFINSPTSLFQKGQSVLVRVIERGHENIGSNGKERQKIVVSLRLKDVAPEKFGKLSKEAKKALKAEHKTEQQPVSFTDDGVKLLENFLNEQKLAVKAMERAKKYPVGALIEVTISDIDVAADEVLCTIDGSPEDSKLRAKIPKEMMAPSFKNNTTLTPTIGLHLEVIVVNHNLAENLLEISACQHLISDVKTKLEVPALPLITGQTVSSECLMVRAGLMAIVALRDHGTGRLAVVPARKHLNDSMEPFTFLQGQSNQVILIRHDVNPVFAMFKTHDRKSLIANALIKTEASSGKESASALLPSGTIVSGEIVSLNSTVLNLKLEDGKFRGRVHISEALPDDQMVPGAKPFHGLIKGQTIKVRVLGVHHRAHHHLQVKAKMFECSMVLEKPSHRRPVLSEVDVLEGRRAVLFVREYRNQYATVEFSRLVGRPARILRLNMAREASSITKISETFPPGSCLGEAEVIRTSPVYEFSLVGRPMPVEPGRIQQGLVFSKSAAIGLQVAFADGSIGHVSLTDILDDFSKSFPTKGIHVNGLVSCMVMKRNDDASWLCSMRPSRVIKTEANADQKAAIPVVDREIDSVLDIMIGDVLSGFVVACKTGGVFVRLGRNVVGRAIFEKTSEYYLVDPEKFFQPGLAVKAKVLNIDHRDITQHLEISLLESDTGFPLDIPKTLTRGKRNQLSNPEKKTETRKRVRSDSTSSAVSTESASSNTSSASKRTRSVVEPVEETKSTAEESQPEYLVAETPRFDFSQQEIVQPPLLGSLLGSGPMEVDEEDEAALAEGQENSKTKKETAREREHRTYALELARLRGMDDAEAAEPKSNDDFDRLVIEKPNSSLVWTRYIAFHLSNLDVAKAREVAERALKAVSFREEAERLNVWVAYFNLENLFGNDESLREIVRRACQEADALQVYERLVDVYIKAEKFEAAEHQMALMTKKFREEPQVWLRQGEYFYSRGKLEAARNALNKALDTLDLRHHVDLIVKFALMEMQQGGEFERGRSLFEKVLANYPRRMDVWNVYIDALLKKGVEDVTGARRLFERMVALKLPYSKARNIFRRFAAFEKQHGDDESMARVEELAKQYLEQSSDGATKANDDNDDDGGEEEKLVKGKKSTGRK